MGRVPRRWFVIPLVLMVLAGCSRGHYAYRADVDAYSILREKAGHTIWEPPFDFDIVPGPASRMFNPTPLVDPWLPTPSPKLYAYDLPELPERDPNRFRPEEAASPPGPDELPQIPTVHIAGSHRRGLGEPRFVRLPPVRPARSVISPQLGPSAWQPVSYLQPMPDDAPLDPLAEPIQPSVPDVDTLGGVQVGSLRKIPKSAWEQVPASCRLRMFEFQSLVDEFKLTYDREPSAEERDDSPALALEDIIDLALLNSREYQTAKEVLYRTALRLSLERFDYDLKFSTGGNRTVVDYTHDRNNGITENTLRLPTTLQADKMLLTGGDLLVNFANQVVLTFNGPNGFAADVGSDLLFDISQTIFQRDVRFESLTQSERDVVYAARDFARFRKEFFVDLATDYYALIRTYRQVEIDSQNYFTLVRAFDQAQEEYEAGQQPRLQVDQVEQNVLRGRSGLISTCNNLEQTLDTLKISIGLPTETPINIDLSELELLTRGDELAVKRELIRRVRQRLVNELSAEEVERGALANSSIVLVDRIFDAFDTLRQMDRPVPEDTTRLRDLQTVLEVDSSREALRTVKAELQDELQRVPLRPSSLFLTTTTYIDSASTLINLQIDLAETRGFDLQRLAELRQQAETLPVRAEELRGEYRRLIEELRLDQSPVLVEEATKTKDEADAMIATLDELLGIRPGEQFEAESLQAARVIADELAAYSVQLMGELGSGLIPVEIDVNDAMMTALVLRFDLMNERGFLADDWRQIKLAADDLKAILNLRASQLISTRRDVNRPFDFTFDESQTRLTATFDAPLNRRAQRNVFRTTLVDYQAALRGLMALEDGIKLQIRNELRDLELDKEQYAIEVAGAALALERVVSTATEQLYGEATARDFLESQQAYAASLSNVASRHINYIVDRMNLFLDLELLTVNETGFWPELYDEQHQPEPYFQLPPYAFPFYGELPPGLKYSPAMRRMQHVPPGTAVTFGDGDDPELSAPEEVLAPTPQPEIDVPEIEVPPPEVQY